MTRDEAIQVLRQPRTSEPAEENWIDAFVALGILKLDEPKSAEDKFVDALKNKFSGEDRIRIYSALSEANLKLVEK